MLEPMEQTKNNLFGLVGCLILLTFGGVALLAEFLAPHSTSTSFPVFLPPSGTHVLGTNDMGYDIFSELLFASRISLLVGLVAALISVFIGTGVGLLSGYYRGAIGDLMTGIIDIFLLIPFLPLMVILAAYLGPSIWNIILVIGLLGWCSTARVVRAKVLQLREMPFIEAAKAVGLSNRSIILRHIFPNVTEVVAAKFVLSVAGAMLSEASLSFLGLGDPARISWGGMIHYAFKRGGFFNGMWYWYLPPGICIALCTIGFVLLGLYLEAKNNQLPADQLFAD